MGSIFMIIDKTEWKQNHEFLLIVCHNILHNLCFLMQISSL